MAPLHAISHTQAAAAAAHDRPTTADGIPVPRTPAEARQLAALFIAQMDASLGAIGSDGADEGGDGSADGSGSDPLAGLSAMLGQSLMGTSGLTSLAGSDGSSPSILAAAGMGSDLLNAPVRGGAGSASLMQNVGVVVEQAKAAGVDPRLAVAMMLVESGGNNRAVGDNGTSFGLFQLHQGGMLTAAGLAPEQAMDPTTNARVALASLARTERQMPHASPGEIAAASQRPADRTAYAAKVNAAYQRAAALIGG